MSRILVVDDHELVRNMTELVLRSSGHDTLTADSAAAALTVLDDSIHVVVTDLTMPGDLDGSDLVHRIRERFPSIGIVVISGYSVQPGTFDDAVQVLNKPFGVDQLADAVARVLPLRDGDQP